MEFIVTAVNFNHAASGDAAKFAYYFNLNQSLDDFGIYPAPTCFPYWIFIVIGAGIVVTIIALVLIKQRKVKIKNT